ncbi:MAG: sigma 54-interacting transcriptional regulator [Edaphobacter sp.]
MSTSRSASVRTAFSLPGVAGPFSTERDVAEIAGSSAAMQRLRVQVRRIGPHFRTVLVSGETGTGKELVARTLHTMSPVADGPFVMRRGAEFKKPLTEADVDVDAADNLLNLSQRGVLFLNGIDEMPLEAQEIFLQALGRHGLGEHLEPSDRADLRIIASTDEDLKILVSTGRFRQELYQRLATVDISLPPLRERVEDLPELGRLFLDRFATALGRRVHEISDEAMERMQHYRWPGNVGELESVLRNGVLQSEGEVLEVHHLHLAETTEPVSATLNTNESLLLQDVAHRHMLHVLKRCEGNKLRAAEMLGISRSTLYRMLDDCSQVGALR